MSASTWTPTRVARLERLWREGCSAAQIARALGCGLTRNAVIGKIHRLGLVRTRARPPVARPVPLRPPPRRKGAVRPVRKPTPIGPAPAAGLDASPTLAESGAATVCSVGRGDCRWPLGEPSSDAFRFCGERAVRGAYCAPHAARAYRATPSDHLLRLAGL